MTIQYVAKDGTVFHDKEECEAYENRTFLAEIIGMNRAGEVMRGDAYGFVEDATMIYLPNMEIVQSFCHLCRTECLACQGIEGPGFYTWNDIDGEWQFVGDLIQEYRDKIGYLKGAMFTIEKELMNK